MLPRRLFAAALMFLGLAGSSIGEDKPLVAPTADLTTASADIAATIPAMDAKALDAVVGQVMLAVNTDSRRLAAFQSSKACLELYRAANSFGIGYRYLVLAGDRAKAIPGAEGAQLYSKATQARVIAFAARVKVAEQIQATCRNFPIPADHAADPRFARPSPLDGSEYTRALLDGRFAAEANLAAALAADRSGTCPDVTSAIQAISLLLPYLGKLYNDSAAYPEALGPAASRRALNQERRQLGAALTQLDRKYSGKCTGKGGPAAAPAAQGAGAGPQSPAQ